MSNFKTKEIKLPNNNTPIMQQWWWERRRNNKNQKKKWGKVIWIILFIIIIWIIFYAVFSYKSFKTKILVQNDLIVKIEAWDNFNNLSKKLNEIKELGSWQYSLYMKNNKPDYQLWVWNYKIKWGSNIQWVIKWLKTPITNDINIVILEWWNIYDIDKCLSDPGSFLYEKDSKEYTCMYKNDWWERVYLKEPLIETWEYISYVTNKEKIDALKQYFPFIDKQETFEWFLYPDTYKVDWINFKINEFVIKQLETFEVKVYEKLLTNYNPEKITEIVNLASIVEKEERNPKEKSTVAWILKKRLNSWWMIWADITVCYPHELTSNECKMVVSKYINEKSDYNTRTMTWLPKTPIWNPSYETIEATINDKKTDYWYYLHNVSTWKIYYWKTNAEHEANKQYMY